MKGKLLFVAGAAVGYVFGARAGRKRYEQIKGAAERIWETPGVQNQVEQAKDFAAQRVGDIPSALADGAQKAFTSLVSSRKKPSRSSGNSSSSRASDASTSTSASTSAGETANSTPSKPAAAKSSTTSASKKSSAASAKPGTKSGPASKSGSGSTSSTRAKSKPAADSE